MVPPCLCRFLLGPRATLFVTVVRLFLAVTLFFPLLDSVRHLCYRGAMQLRRVFVVGGLHFFVDIYAGFFAIYLVIAGLDPVKAALISSAAAFISNGLQPLMGFWTDRVRGKLPVFLGVMVGALAMSAIGLTENFAVLFVLLLCGSIGVSLFHPAGVNIAGAAGRDRKERSVSLFIFIGTIGFSLSQPFFSLVTGIVGTRFSPLLALPAVVLALTYLLVSRVGVSGPKQRVELKSFGRAMKGRVAVMLGLFLIMVLRHGFIMTVGFFLAKVFAEWGFSRLSYSFAHTFYALSGAAGILVSGIFAHRFRTKAI